MSCSPKCFRLLVVAPYINPRVKKFAEFMHTCGHKVSLAVTKDCWLKYESSSSLGTATAMSTEGLPVYGISPTVNVQNHGVRFLTSFLKLVLQLVQLCITKRIDVIIAYCPTLHTGVPALIAGKITRRKVVMDYADLAYYGDSKYIIRAAIEILAVRNSDKVVSLTEVWKDFLVRHFRIKEDRIAVISNAVDPNDFHMETINPSRIKAELGIEKNSKCIVFAGSNRYMETKRGLVDLVDVGIIIRALPFIVQEFPNVVVILLGIRNDPFLEKTIASYGVEKDKIIFCGGYIYGGFKHLSTLAIADCLILPAIKSLTYEYFDRFKIYEYMLMNKPIVAANNQASREILGSSAIYYIAEDEKDLASKICYILEHPENTLMCEKLRSIVLSNHTWNIKAEKFCSFVIHSV